MLRQISDNRMRKKNMNSENQENELQLVTFAENRRALAEKKSILTKEAILEDAKRRKEMERARKEKEIADRAK